MYIASFNILASLVHKEAGRWITTSTNFLGSCDPHHFNFAHFWNVSYNPHRTFQTSSFFSSNLTKKPRLRSPQTTSETTQSLTAQFSLSSAPNFPRRESRSPLDNTFFRDRHHPRNRVTLSRSPPGSSRADPKPDERIVSRKPRCRSGIRGSFGFGYEIASG